MKDIDQGTEINPQCISKRNVRGEKGLTTKEKKGPLGDENQEATSTRSQKADFEIALISTFLFFYFDFSQNEA